MTSAVAAVSLVALVACSSSGTPEASPTGDSGEQQLEESLRVSTSANSGRPGLEAVAPLFEAEAGVSVKTEFGELGSGTYTSQLLTELQNGAAPDVMAAFPGTGTSSPNLGSLASSGNLMDLSDTEWGRSIPETIRSAASHDGQVYAAILGIQFGAIIYNTELFEEHGLEPPTTFGDLIDLVGEIREKAPDAVPISFGASNSAISMIVTSMFAVNEPGLDPDDLDFASSDAWRGALQQLLDLHAAGAYSPSVVTDDANSIISQVTSGQAFMAIDVTSRYSAIKRTDPELPIAMVPYPAAEPGENRMLIWPGTTMVVNAAAESPVAALEWIDFVTSPEITLTWTEAAGGAEFPPTQLDDVDAWPEHFEGLKSDEVNAQMIPAVTWPSADIGNALGEGVPALLLGAKSIDDVLAEMTAAAQ